VLTVVIARTPPPPPLLPLLLLLLLVCHNYHGSLVCLSIVSCQSVTARAAFDMHNCFNCVVKID